MRAIRFNTTILKFGQQGEKTGWTYIVIPADLAVKLKPNNKLGFRVKGRLDKLPVKGIALLPMGGGDFIIPLNAAMRKAIGKRHGAMLDVFLQEDKQGFVFNKDFMDCMEDEPAAKIFFTSLPGSHQRYFSKWIDSAKTDATRAQRIARAVNALSKKWGYAQMLRNSL
jgi:hypothetical protein